MNGRARFVNPSLSTLVCALVACGTAENLSVGDVRCEGVSCEPVEIVPIPSEQIEVEQIDRQEELTRTIDPSFCSYALLSELAGKTETNSLTPLGGEPGADDPTCLASFMVVVGQQRFVVGIAYLEALGSERFTAGLRLAGYVGDSLEWESKELSRELEIGPGYFGDSFALAPGIAAGEAIVGVTLESGGSYAYGQRFYAVRADGELQDLFEDESAGRIRALAVLGDDIVVASDYEQHLELTRYDRRGDIVWRQTTLALGSEYPSTSTTDPVYTALRVIDGERIIALIPREHSFQAIELNARGEHARTWIEMGGSIDDERFFGARLVSGPDGQIVVGVDGYEIKRGSLEGAEPRLEAFIKQRAQYYSPSVLALHVDQAGYIYVATLDGIRDHGFNLLERISPDLTQRESFVIASGESALQPSVLAVTGDLYVTEDQRTLYYSAGGAIGTVALPPIE